MTLPNTAVLYSTSFPFNSKTPILEVLCVFSILNELYPSVLKPSFSDKLTISTAIMNAYHFVVKFHSIGQYALWSQNDHPCTAVSCWDCLNWLLKPNCCIVRILCTRYVTAAIKFCIHKLAVYRLYFKGHEQPQPHHFLIAEEYLLCFYVLGLFVFTVSRGRKVCVCHRTCLLNSW